MNRNSAERIQSIHQEPFIDGPRIGRIVEIDAAGTVRVDYDGNIRGPLPARVAASVKERLEKRSGSEANAILLLFENGDPGKPVIFDMVAERIAAPRPDSADEEQSAPGQDICIDGRSINYNAKDQIVLRCGKASITLTKAGKIIIRGAYLLNRSSGVNRIKGGSVQIN